MSLLQQFSFYCQATKNHLSTMFQMLGGLARAFLNGDHISLPGEYLGDFQGHFLVTVLRVWGDLLLEISR